MTSPTAHPTDSARINEDRECPNCGYNLRGLSRGGACPECGRKIGGKVAARFRDNIAYAPPSYLRTLRNGLAIMVASLPLFVVGMCVPGLGFLGSIAWAGGAWIALTKRPLGDGTVPDPILESGRLRAAARWMQLPSIAAGVLLALSQAALPAGGGPTLLSTSLGVLGGLALIVSMAGYIPLSVYLSAIAHWASHDSAAARLRGSSWVMCVFGVGMAVCFGIPVLRFFGLWLSVGWFFAVVFFLIAVLQLSHGLHWAVKHQRYAEGSAARVAEKVAKRVEAPTVVHDLMCRKCKYDLEGLPFGGSCPECGESYADATPLPVRDLPRRAPEDESPIPLAEGEGGAAKQIHFPTRFGNDQQAVGGPPPKPPPKAPVKPDPFAPKPLAAGDPGEPGGTGELGDDAIDLEPEDPSR